MGSVAAAHGSPTRRHVMPIQLYVVGLYFNKSINFISDGSSGGKATMSGAKLLSEAKKAYPSFSYKLVANYLTQLSYAPTSPADFKPGSTNTSLIGYMLSHTENLIGFPGCSEVLQYTSDLPPTTPTASRPPFGTNGFQDKSDVRVRLLKIYEPGNTTLWGAINADGTVATSSGGFTVKRTDVGTYVIDYTSAGFASIPALVGSQDRFGGGQSTLDNVVFPNVSNTQATAVTGDSNGKAFDRSFAFSLFGAASI